MFALTLVLAQRTLAPSSFAGIGGVVRHSRREKDGGEQPQLAPLTPRPAKPKAIPFAQRLTCTIDEACEATGLGRTKVYELIGAGQLLTRTVGRRRLVLIRSLFLLFEMNMPK